VGVYKLLTDHLVDAVKMDPNKIAVIDRFGKYTYGELEFKARRLAFGLMQRGVKKGDPVVVQLPNWHHFTIFRLALTYLGAVIVPVTTAYRRSDISYVLKFTRSRYLVIPGYFRNFDYIRMIKGIRDELPDLSNILVINGKIAENMESYDNFMQQPWEDISPNIDLEKMRPGYEDVTEILFTSGTTGRPKGVMRRSNILEKINSSLTQFYNLSSSDVIFMPTPITHASGLWHGVRLPIFLGATTVLQDIWDPGEALKLCQDNMCTLTIVPPAMLQDLIYSPKLDNYGRLSSMRYMIMSGAIEKVLTDAHVILPNCNISSCYGGTDFGFVSGCMNDDPLQKRFTTDGRPLPGVEAKIIRDDGSNADVGEEGEILLKGLNCAGYYKQPDQNDQVFTSDGFFHTGDVGRIDDEGFIKLTGRLKDIIRRGGINIAPLEVEQILLNHPGIANVAVVGIPDTRLDERACACIILEEGHTITLDDVTKWMNKAGVTKQKWPEKVEIFDIFPLSVFGRVQKFEVRKLLLERLNLLT